MNNIHNRNNWYQNSKLEAAGSWPYIYLVEQTNFQEPIMINAPAQTTFAAPSHSLLSLVVAFFTLSLREKLEPGYTGQDSDPAYYGCGL